LPPASSGGGGGPGDSEFVPPFLEFLPMFPSFFFEQNLSGSHRKATPVLLERYRDGSAKRFLRFSNPFSS
jgi:hypothetical protein